MATGPETTKRIGQSTGEVLKTSAVAKIQKQQDPPMMPRSPQGGGENAEHAEPYHLINLILGVAVADPVAEAPSAVRRYRALTLVEHHVTETTGNTIRHYTEDAGRSTLEPLFHMYGLSLGERLDGLVSTLQKSENQHLRALFRASEFGVKLTLGRHPRAEITVVLGIHSNKTRRSETSIYAPPQQRLPISDDSEPTAQIRREVVIPFALIDVLIDLWDDTLSYRAKRAAEAAKTPAKRGSAEPVNETAVLLAGNAAATTRATPLQPNSSPRNLVAREKNLKRRRGSSDSTKPHAEGQQHVRRTDRHSDARHPL
jgi:hypothetical protein